MTGKQNYPLRTARVLHLGEKIDEKRAPVCLLLPALDFLMLALLQPSPEHLATAQNGCGTQTSSYYYCVKQAPFINTTLTCSIIHFWALT